jgi:hypothetical protein
VAASWISGCSAVEPEVVMLPVWQLTVAPVAPAGAVGEALADVQA